MNLLEREIRARPPRRVLEFGSGLSTSCLSRCMAGNPSGAPPPYIVSVEENADFCAESRKIVAEHGLDGLASIQHTALVKKEIAGRSVNAYDLPAATLPELEAAPPDLVFIDGPSTAGGRFARWAVMHLVIPLLPAGFRFYLDDALSDSALECAQLWAQVPGVKVADVSLVGHGVLVGEFRAST
jgi:predicted O-methyltransferase YrrM